MKSGQRKTILPDPQYLFDSSGKKSLVVLTISEYEKLLKYFNETALAEEKADVNKPERKPKDRKSQQKIKFDDFYGIFKSKHLDYVRQITEDKQIYYDNI